MLTRVEQERREEDEVARLVELDDRLDAALRVACLGRSLCKLWPHASEPKNHAASLISCQSPLSIAHRPRFLFTTPICTLYMHQKLSAITHMVARKWAGAREFSCPLAARELPGESARGPELGDATLLLLRQLCAGKPLPSSPIARSLPDHGTTLRPSPRKHKPLRARKDELCVGIPLYT